MAWAGCFEAARSDMRWLLRLLVSDADRRSIEADLMELYEIRRRHDGADSADRWLRRQRFIYPWHLFVDRLRTSVSGGISMQHLWRDFRYSVRSLRRSPALSATIVLTSASAWARPRPCSALSARCSSMPCPMRTPDSLVWIYTDTPPYRFQVLCRRLPRARGRTIRPSAPSRLTRRAGHRER